MTTIDKGAGRLPLGPVLSETVRRVPDMWRGAGGALALTAALAVALLFLPDLALIRAGLWVGLTLAGLVAFGAITRIGVARDLHGARAMGLGPLGFQFMKTEARLAGATLLCGLFLTIMLSLLALVALALFGAAGLDAEAVRARDWAAVGPVWKLALLSFVGLVVLGTPVVFAIRLSLYAQATVGRDQMISLTATALTNGAMLPLFAGLVVAELPKTLWLVLYGAGLLPGLAGPILGLLVLAGLQAPLTAAFLGAAYRRLETHAALGAWQ